jgi:hypothetical protein
MSDATVLIALGGREWEIARARLGDFLKLQQARESVLEGVRSDDNGKIVGGLYAFLRVMLSDLTLEEFHQAPWDEVATAYLLIEQVNILPHRDEFAIIRYAMGDGDKVPWANPLRPIMIWVHLIAKAYGWSRDAIFNLLPEEAIALVQEILADSQIDREFMHALSEISYEYNKTTKKSHYKPLQRPAWMVFGDRKGGIKKTKLRKDWLPKGNVIYPKDAGDAEIIH